MVTLSNEKCTLTLYHKDKRFSDKPYTDSKELSLTTQTIEKTYDAICGYFQLINEWDKKLFQSALRADTEYYRFSFTRSNSPNVTCGIKTEGDRKMIFNSEPETFEVLDKRTRKVEVRVMSHFAASIFDLTREDFHGDCMVGQSIVALYNSESVIDYYKVHSKTGVMRYYKVIDP